jgi:hypothetical protein
MKAKTFLGRAYRLDLKINTKLEQLEQFRSLAYKVTSNLSEDKVSNGTKSKGSLEDSIIKIIMAEQELNAEIYRLIAIKKDIAETISLLSIEDEKLLLELRYICFNSWEEIAVKMNFSCSYTHRLNRHALENIETILKTRSMIINA